MTLGVRGKLFLTSVGVISLSVIAADAYLSTAIEDKLTERIRADLLVRLSLVEREVSRTPAAPDDLGAWDALADALGARARARVTFIRVDGVVIGDSQVDRDALPAVENHRGRPEVGAALSQGQGTSTRHSGTVGQRLMYVAIPFWGAGEVLGVARLAMPLTEVDEAIWEQRRLLLVATAVALVVAILLSTLAAQWMSKRVRSLTRAARRMAEGDLAVRTHVAGRDEVATLGQTLDQLASSLSATVIELRAERDLLGRILDAMTEGLLVLDAAGTVVLVNTALREMLLLGTDAVGRPAEEVLHHESLVAALARARVAGARTSAEIEIGGIKPRRLLCQTSPLWGEPPGLVAVFADVTEIRRLESLRRDFVANVSHELRTPVAAILSAAETLEGPASADPAAARGFVEIIARNADRLHRLVADLLDLSRIEAKEYRLEPEVLPLGPLVERVLELFRERAAKKRLALEAAIPEDAVARADRRAVEQVLTNLVDNAVKYSREGAEVRVVAQVEPALVRVSVRDTGGGIEAHHLPRLFERFYRVDSGRARGVGGTGLGLSIVKHLVEAMGGAVGVDSVVGQGTTFTFTLPRAAPEP